MGLMYFLCILHHPIIILQSCLKRYKVGVAVAMVMCKMQEIYICTMRKVLKNVLIQLNNYIILTIRRNYPGS